MNHGGPVCARNRLMGAVVLTVLLVASALGGATPARAQAAPAAPATVQLRVTASDGVELEARLSGSGPLVGGRLPARPTIVEMSPYGDAAALPPISSEYNLLEVHVRGTGESDGSFDALGPRTQQDLADVLGWACEQPWTNGRLGLWGFSASAIVAYNSLHLELPCVEAAVLGAGTHELYRDLLYPGGIPNLAPGLVVLAGIGGGALLAGGDRLQRAPETSLDTITGLTEAGLSFLAHPTLDDWWRERGMRGSVNDFPVLMVTGFFDVESRGPFQAFQELRDRGAHLYVVGAHDGVPAGTGGADAERLRWYDRHLRDVANGVDREPAVQLWMADGDREDLLAGRFVRARGDDWPIPGTAWETYYLDPARSGSAPTVNDGTLSRRPGADVRQSYLAVPSLPTATDPHTIATVGVLNDSPLLTDMTLAEPLGLSYTTAPFDRDVVAAGPASVEVLLSSTAPETDVLTVLSDVGPDGSAHPVATGRLRTSYPSIDLGRSLVAPDGTVVQPYSRFDRKDPAAIGQERRYQVELWPIGNRFRAGHRLRLHLVGASAFGVPSLPALNTVRLGGSDGSALHVPVLPASALVLPAPPEPSEPRASSSQPSVGPSTPGDPAPARRPDAGVRAAAVPGTLFRPGGDTGPVAGQPVVLALAAALVLRRSWRRRPTGRRALVR